MKDKIISVGIDLGTSTTQVMFSSLVIENLASDYAVPKLSIVDKKIIYESEIFFTPLLSQTKIDGEKIKKIVESEYDKAGIKFSDVKTGAVIITGETARKENAALVVENLSSFAGDFVVATAGPDLESVLAGFGSGAGAISEKNHQIIVNLDIGGGTSNIAVFNSGRISGAACLDIGGRLIKIDKTSGKITYVYSKIQKLSEKIGFPVKAGEIADEKKLSRITDAMAQILADSLGAEKSDSEICDEGFYTNGGKSLAKENLHFNGLTFSGGVSALIYSDSKKDFDNDVFKFGDIGILLAQSILKNEFFKKIQILTPKETIRATVVGAGMYTTEISGSTILYTKEILPVKNIPVLHIEDDEIFHIEEILQKNLPWYINQNAEKIAAISFNGTGYTGFDQIQELSKKIVAGCKILIEEKIPLVIVLETDIAKAFGFALKNLLGQNYPLICIDGIKTSNGDFIDIGNPVAGGQVLPVVIKTLVFNT